MQWNKFLLLKAAIHPGYTLEFEDKIFLYCKYLIDCVLAGNCGKGKTLHGVPSSIDVKKRGFLKCAMHVQ